MNFIIHELHISRCMYFHIQSTCSHTMNLNQKIHEYRHLEIIKLLFPTLLYVVFLTNLYFASLQVIRLHLLLTVKESAINVPQNLDARRRITFFANSLFMNMPKAPKVQDMLSFRLVIMIRP